MLQEEEVTGPLEIGAIIAIAGAMSLTAVLLSRFLGKARPTDSTGVNRYECGIRNQASDRGFVYRSEYGAVIAVFIVIEAAMILSLISMILGRFTISSGIPIS
jgi:NADH:ubiquinone oxidoreductase subunit 3 (subunit A)